MKDLKLEQNEIIKKYLKLLEDFEIKYTPGWVKRTYENPPEPGSQYFDFGTKMHAIYQYRKNGMTGDLTTLVAILGNKTELKDKSEEITIPRLKRNKSISPHLSRSVTSFYKQVRRQLNSSEEIYQQWLSKKEAQIPSKKVKTHIQEAVERKDAVISLLNKNIAEYIKIRDASNKQVLSGAKKKKIKNHNSINKELFEPSKELDVYYLAGGIYAKRLQGEPASIVIVKNYTLLLQTDVGNKSIIETDYLALNAALQDVTTKKAVIYSCSRLLVDSVTSVSSPDEINLKQLYLNAQKLMEGKDILIRWTPFNKNIAVKELSALENKVQVTS